MFNIILFVLLLTLYQCYSQHPKFPHEMNIGIMTVGTTGDINPFIAIGMKLKEDGHRVRIASHANYREKVLTRGLEFYPLDGDPTKLSEYMVTNHGRLYPSNWKSLKMFPTMFKEMKRIIYSTYPAMTESDPHDSDHLSFHPDIIIANPPVYGHLHVAEKLQVPLHIMVPQPWIETKSFPHPLMCSKRLTFNCLSNRWTYYLVEFSQFIGMYTIFYSFRKLLGLSTDNLWMRFRHLMYFPHSFLWSPLLLSKPEDWSENVDIVGTVRLPEDINGNSEQHYQPPETLETFLEEPKRPIYIGFGSMIVENAQQVKKEILKAAISSNTRIILQSGWTNWESISTEYDEKASELVYILDKAPHTWLFQHVSGVIHHGGLGTTIAGLIAGQPTFIIPFIVDQWLWSKVLLRLNIGFVPFTISDISSKKLIKIFHELQDHTLKNKVERLGSLISQEDGAINAKYSVYRHFPLHADEFWKSVNYKVKQNVLNNIFSSINR